MWKSNTRCGTYLIMGITIERMFDVRQKRIKRNKRKCRQSDDPRNLRMEPWKRGQDLKKQDDIFLEEKPDA